MTSSKERIKQLENALCKISGENWADYLEIPASSSNIETGRRASPGRKLTISSQNNTSPALTTGEAANTPGPNNAETIAHLEQVRLLILGMEQRLHAREEKLSQSISRAEKEGRKFEEMSKQLAAPINT
jgi:hypothetical protein